jgi:hypothetical protein
MSEQRMEEVLAGLYADATERERFLRDPGQYAAACGLDEDERRALVGIDRTGLDMAARSYAAKRAAHAAPRRPAWRQRLRWLLRG